MPARTPRRLTLGSLLLLGGWACAGEPSTGPSTAPVGTTAAAVTYEVRDLGTLGGTSSHAYGINTKGVIVGSSSTASGGSPRGFVWQNGKMTKLSALAGGESEAFAINDDGIIVGASITQAGLRRAVRWQNGKIRNLGTLGGKNSEARAINESGAIVGWSENKAGQRRAFIWQNGVMTELKLPAGFAGANGINRSGTVVGQYTNAAGEGRAFRWKDGVFKDIGIAGRPWSFASAINTKGQIVGSVGDTEDAAGEEQDFAFPFLYYQEVVTLIGHTSGRSTTYPRAISPTGLVVGQGMDLSSEAEEETAWYVQDGVGARLPTLANLEFDNHAGAEGVNRAGTIVGFSVAANGQTHAVRWVRQ